MLNYTEILKYINSGLITTRKHPSLPLEILNYTQRVQFDKLWDPYTKSCRGLILDSNHNIISRPFPKFFNLGEIPETFPQNLPNEIPEITEKLDGSLGILYFENDLPSIATRGSFESPQALWATQFIRNKGYTKSNFKSDYTYLFEIICSESKNVISYNFEELVLIAVISNLDGSELLYKEEAIRLRFPFVKQYQFKTILEINSYLKTIPGNILEGFVCKYSNGLRVKIKSEDYKRLHKILSGFGERDILEYLSTGKSLDSFLNTVPDEFFQFIKETEEKFLSRKELILKEAEEISLKASLLNSRREQAQYILFASNGRPNGFSGLCFAILDHDSNQIQKSVWNILKP